MRPTNSNGDLRTRHQNAHAQGLGIGSTESWQRWHGQWLKVMHQMPARSGSKRVKYQFINLQNNFQRNCIKNELSDVYCIHLSAPKRTTKSNTEKKENHQKQPGCKEEGPNVDQQCCSEQSVDQKDVASQNAPTGDRN